MSDSTTRALEELAAMRAQLSADLTACVIAKAILSTRIAALECQVAVLEQAAIDQEAHEVYRRAAVMMSTHTSAIRLSVEDERAWSQLVLEVDAQLQRERVH